MRPSSSSATHAELLLCRRHTPASSATHAELHRHRRHTPDVGTRRRLRLRRHTPSSSAPATHAIPHARQDRHTISCRRTTTGDHAQDRHTVRRPRPTAATQRHHVAGYTSAPPTTGTNPMIIKLLIPNVGLALEQKNSHSRTKDAREAQHREVCRRRTPRSHCSRILAFCPFKWTSQSGVHGV